MDAPRLLVLLQGGDPSDPPGVADPRPFLLSGADRDRARREAVAGRSTP